MLTKLPDVTEEPNAVVRPWVVLELLVGTLPDITPPYRFVVGFDPASRLGRVSTLIVEHDPVTRRVRTRSGRTYELSGPPALDADAWLVWQKQFGAVRFRDATADFWPGYEPGSAKVVDTRVAELLDALRK